jgi:hypothetical protein
MADWAEHRRWMVNRLTGGLVYVDAVSAEVCEVHSIEDERSLEELPSHVREICMREFETLADFEERQLDGSVLSSRADG